MATASCATRTETIFHGDDFTWDGRDLPRNVDTDDQFFFGFIFNPRTPYDLTVTDVSQPPHLRTPPEFDLGPNREYGRVRQPGSFRVRFEVKDMYGQRDTLPVDVMARGLRISRLTGRTVDPHGRAQQRCFGLGCAGGGTVGGLEGRNRLTTALPRVVYGPTGLDLEVLATGHPMDAAALAQTQWTLALGPGQPTIQGSGTAPTLTGPYPPTNAGWGLKLLSAETTIDTFDLRQGVPIFLHFPRDARVSVNGDAAVPNWFRYWLPVIRNSGLVFNPDVRVAFDATPGTRLGRYTDTTRTVAIFSTVETDWDQTGPTGPNRLFRHTYPCSHAAVVARGWAFPQNDADDAALLRLIGGARTLTPPGYCRLNGVTQTLNGIQALAYVWQHEAAHVAHFDRMAAWLAAAPTPCIGAACDARITLPNGATVRLPASLHFWSSTSLGTALQCGVLVNQQNMTRQRWADLNACWTRILAWVEFVASVAQFAVDPAGLTPLEQQDWAFPGARYAP